MIKISFVCNGEKKIKKLDFGNSNIMPVLRDEILNGNMSNIEILRQSSDWQLPKLNERQE